MTARAENRSRQRGIALPMALWVAMGLALLAAGIATTAERAINRQIGADQIAVARALLETGLSQGVILAVHPDPARRLPANGTPLTVAEPEGTLTLRLWDEAGRLDLNRTPSARLLAVAGALLPAADLSALTQALQRRRQTGEPWHSVLELGAALSPDGFARIYPCLTVHGPAMADGKPRLSAMAPDLRTRWPGLAGLRDTDAASLAALGLMQGGPPSNLFTLRVAARTPDGALATAEAVVWITIQGTQAFRILEWREPAPEIRLMEEAS